MTANGWFEIDKSGLADTVSEPARLPLELYQNAVDEDCKTITITLTPAERRGYAEIVVADDSPEGFSDLTESYKMYARSKKRDDPTKRGRLNVGEKRVLACCHEASITSTTGTVLFRSDGTRLAAKTSQPTGTTFRGLIRLRRPEQAEALQLLRMVLPPADITLTVNGEAIPHRPPLRSTKATLATVLPDEEGRLSRKTRRATEVHLVEPLDGEVATIYEMGVPVVEHDGRWHIDVAQRVPLNDERDNVPPSFLRELRVAVLDVAHDLLTSVDAKKAWVTDALPKAAPEALRTVVEQIHGKDAVIADPSNREATKIAADQGRVIVHGRQFTAETWAAIKNEGILQPAGQVIRTGVPTSPDGKPPIPQDEWTDDMLALAVYVTDVGEHLLGFKPTVRFQNMTIGTTAGHALAWYGGGAITFNLGRLGKRWPETASQQDVDEILLHEFAHNKVRDHLSLEFVSECCRLGAKLRNFEGTLR